MGIYKNLIFATMLFMLSDLAQSRPVSWAGGSTIMYRTNSMMSSYTFHYSPTYKYNCPLSGGLAPAKSPQPNSQPL